MAKLHYIAVDPDGVVHKRTTDRRVYTHTVVGKRSYELALKEANDGGWGKTDASNYDYYVLIANGNDPYPGTYWRKLGEAHWAAADGVWTQEEVDEEKARVDAENAKRIADAKARVDGLTKAEYMAKQRADNIARIEQKKAEGYYEVFVNCGWCGRRDLAQKLAGAQPRLLEVTILPAELK